MFHQCSPYMLLEPSVLAIKKGHFSVVLSIVCLKSVNFFILSAGNTPNKVIMQIFIIDFLYCVVYLKIRYSFKHFASYKVNLCFFCSDIRPFLIFLFDILITPSLLIFGVCFIPSSIIFCPRADLKMWKLMFRPDFSKLPIILCPLCFSACLDVLFAQLKFPGRLLLLILSSLA